ncbi:hypothetical protein PAXINDRAFT_121498 [Paxillus involutus ATCC 200175]|uniref:Unplaced genomic scaffold PAXINscaffold_906, whole genome shotgun sequence n=1 Tax=Paxillus involutus ATCC 200175 TaxID=664439 RepID=A0A0C9SVK7_PAXIN|nr:hypothetical protein PAXINDRAFT_121498 [Paxillus involutus ATCC 200175]
METPHTPPPSPPKSTTVSAIVDTLPRSRHTSGVLYRTGDLGYGRTAVLRDLHRIPIVSLSHFKEFVLPRSNLKTTPASIHSALAEENVHIQDGRWVAFTKNPSETSLKEDLVFEGLQRVFGAIIGKAQDTDQRRPTVTLVNSPTATPQSARNNTSRPDAYLLMNQNNKKSFPSPSGDTRDSWDDIAVSFEFKKQNSESKRIDNDQKLIWSLHHTMRNDPCRRFTFGVTIEDTKVRLWFTCRSVTMVSEAFDFVTDPEELIYLVCALAFADDEDLGWDPTIQRVMVEDQIQYDITFREQGGSPAVYRTVAIISDFGADAMTGRGTRVFKAYLRSLDGKSPSGPVNHVVIKDAWRDSDRDREDQILQKILSDIGQDKAEDAKKYFLTVLRAEDVSIKGGTDDTRQLLHGATTLGDCSWHDVWPDKEPSRGSHLSSAGHTPTYLTRQGIPPAASAKIQHKKHFRIVFKEVCQPIFELKSLRDVLETLLHAVAGLKFLHLAGWVHRDISVGNVLRHGNRGLIADLEYAKRTDSNQSHEVRTGTPDFMACEVEAQKYQFLSAAPISMDIFKGPEPARPVQPPFRANSLHDLESLWWILIWVLHYHLDARNPVFSPEQEALYQRYFPGLSRGLGQTRLSSLMVDVEKLSLPTTFGCAAWVANVLRVALRDSYQGAENYSGVTVEKSYPLCSRYFSKGLQRAFDEAGSDVLLLPLHDLKKRKVPEPVEEKAGIQPTKRSKP